MNSLRVLEVLLPVEQVPQPGGLGGDAGLVGPLRRSPYRRSPATAPSPACGREPPLSL